MDEMIERIFCLIDGRNVSKNRVEIPDSNRQF
jgi:hypothetical protein